MLDQILRKTSPQARLSMRKLLTILIFSFISAESAFAEIDGLFNIELSKPFPIKPQFTSEKNKDFPIDMFLVPVPNNYEVGQFQDVNVSVSQLTGVVAGIRTETAYLTLDECEEEKEKIVKLLDKKYPLNKNEKSKKTWRYSEEDGSKVANVSCSIKSGAPYPILKISIIDMNENKKVTDHFKRLRGE